MRLKNKKTGEIGYLYEHSLTQDIIIVYDVKGIVDKYKSITELCEEWEDAPEEPKEYWYIYADKPQRADCGDILEEDFKAIGNYFETKEEAEKAVEKLKAWKRLKDKGFRFIEGYLDINNDFIIKAKLGTVGLIDQPDVHLLFGSEEHREEKKKYLRKYYRDNKERLRKQNLKRQRRRLQNDSIYKLKRQVSLLIWRSFNQRDYVKPAHSEEILGCKLDKFTTYLKQTWLKEYGTEWAGQPCHIDHIVPLATAKTKEDVVKLCHYTNLRLLTPQDNMEKSDSLDYAISNKLIQEEK